jgi:hypothetical protein
LGDVENRIHYIPQHRRARPAAAVFAGHVRRDHRPLPVCSIACIPQLISTIFGRVISVQTILCLRRSSQPRLNHKGLKSLNLISGQPLRPRRSELARAALFARSAARRDNPQCIALVGSICRKRGHDASGLMV